MSFLAIELLLDEIPKVEGRGTGIGPRFYCFSYLSFWNGRGSSKGEKTMSDEKNNQRPINEAAARTPSTADQQCAIDKPASDEQLEQVLEELKAEAGPQPDEGEDAAIADELIDGDDDALDDERAA